MKTTFFQSFWRSLSPLALSTVMGLGLSACCSSSHAQQPTVVVSQDLLESVRTLISGYEHVPTAKEWSDLGETTAVSQALMTLADEGGVTGARALSSLAHFPTPQVESFLLSRVRGERIIEQDRPDWQRGKAAITLGVAFGDTHAETLAKLLTEPSEALREDALRAFRHLRSTQVESFLKQRISKEPSEHLKGVLQETAQWVAQRRQEEEARGVLKASAQKVKAIKDPGAVRKSR